MELINYTDERCDAIRKFDDCMEEFLQQTVAFVEEIKRIRHSDENKMKIFTLGLNYSYDIKLVADNVLKYKPFIENSLLDTRYDYHKKLLNDTENKTNELSLISKSILNSHSIGVEEYVNGNADTPPSTQIVLANDYNKLNTEICKSFEESGYTCYGIILQSLKIIIDALSVLYRVNVTRDDNAYEQLYDNMERFFYESEEWKTVKDIYINQLFRRRFIVSEPTIEELEKINADLYLDLTNDSAVGVLWFMYMQEEAPNKSEFARCIARKCFQDSSNLDYLFTILGKMEIIEEWIKDKVYEEDPFNAFEVEGVRSKVEFVGNWNEDRFLKKWEQIKDYMLDNNLKTKDWCILHHTMSFYNMIEVVDFSVFMRWLMGITNETSLMTEVNIRQVKTDYFVKTVKEKWDIEEMRKYKDTAQYQNKFRIYAEHCIGIKEILIS